MSLAAWVEIHYGEILVDRDVRRREALRNWKNSQGLRATYGNLLELFVKAEHSECAKAVREMLRKKCKDCGHVQLTTIEQCQWIMHLE